MIARVTGYKKGVSKNGKDYVRLSYVRAKKFDGEVGDISESNFIPSYLIDKADSFVGKKCSINLQKSVDPTTQKATYSISDIEPVDNVPNGDGWYL